MECCHCNATESEEWLMIKDDADYLYCKDCFKDRCFTVYSTYDGDIIGDENDCTIHTTEEIIKFEEKK